MMGWVSPPWSSNTLVRSRTTRQRLNWLTRRRSKLMTIHWFLKIDRPGRANSTASSLPSGSTGTTRKQWNSRKRGSGFREAVELHGLDRGVLDEPWPPRLLVRLRLRNAAPLPGSPSPSSVGLSLGLHRPEVLAW
jgi:hypothetical protein